MTINAKIEEHFTKRWQQGWETEIKMVVAKSAKHIENLSYLEELIENLVTEVYVTAWRDGFTAKLSGVSDDDR
jgi:hypothetical protein